MAIASDVHSAVTEPLAPGVHEDRHLDTPTLLPARDFIADATARIRSARNRVRVIALTIADEHETEQLITALCEAAAAGVDVHVAADTFTYADLAGRFLPKRYLSKSRRKSLDLTRKLTSAGVTFDWLGLDRGLPWRGRTHSKFCVVDDTVYSFGGVNLDDQGVTNIDFMLRVEDSRLADDLAKVYRRIRKANTDAVGHRSVALKYGKDQVLVDGGIVGDSIIYRRAVKYARKSERVLLISQYCPTGALVREITARPHELWFNPPRNARALNRWLIRVSMFMTRTSTSYRKREYLHAKCIVFYLKDGKRIALTGSHNFVWGGVALGTREIALLTRNPDVIDQIERFHARSVVGDRAPGSRSRRGRGGSAHKVLR